jgi:hypothetical protein
MYKVEKERSNTIAYFSPVAQLPALAMLRKSHCLAISVCEVEVQSESLAASHEVRSGHQNSTLTTGCSLRQSQSGQLLCFLYGFSKTCRSKNGNRALGTVVLVRDSVLRSMTGGELPKTSKHFSLELSSEPEKRMPALDKYCLALYLPSLHFLAFGEKVQAKPTRMGEVPARQPNSKRCEAGLRTNLAFDVQRPENEDKDGLQLDLSPNRNLKGRGSRVGHTLL